jgi:hypothetical protein
MDKAEKINRENDIDSEIEQKETAVKDELNSETVKENQEKEIVEKQD